MINTFFTAAKIKRAFTINGAIHSLRSIPLIGKYIPYSVYSSKGIVKVFAGILYVLQRILTFCSLDIIYISLLVIASGAFANIVDNDIGNIFVILYFFFGLGGLFVNNILFDVSEDRFYGIILMHLNAKKYVLSEMLYKLLRKFIGHGIVLIPVAIIMSINPLTIMALLSMTILGKFLGAYIKLKFIEKDNLKKHSSMLLAIIVITLGLAGGSAYYLSAFSNLFIVIVAILICIAGAYFTYKLFVYDDYLKICKKILTEESVIELNNAKAVKVNEQKNAREVAEKSLKKDFEVTKDYVSDKSGYALFNDLFVKRHSGLLAKRSRNISLIITFLGIGLIGVLWWETNKYGEDRFLELSTIIYSLPILMYFLNTGESLTTVMFANCDVAMLTYNFYKNPKVMLGIFKERLKTVIKFNIVPAALLSMVLDGICYFIVETKGTISYVAIPVLCLSLSIFFSVHRLVIYYVLQPYTVGLQKKSVVYSFVNGATYLFCYFLMMTRDGNNFNPMVFALISIIFSVIYVLVALPLVYKFAPKRFKVHG